MQGMREKICLLLLIGLALASCSTTKSVAAKAPTALVPAKPTPTSFMAKLAKKYNPYPIQDDPDTSDDCASFYMKADTSIPYQGVAVFFHGFTGCPQQFYEMAQILSKRGYASFVPLLPGQGKGPAPFAETDNRMINGMPYKDYYASNLPKIQNDDWKRYLNFVADINKFIATLPGEKILGGLSVGGSLATYAYIESPELYKRVLLVSPFYGMPGAYLGLQSQTSGPWQAVKRLAGDTIYRIERKIIDFGSRASETVAEQEVSWGEDCYRQTRGYNGNPGRRGICDFRYENLAAINALGDFVIDHLKSNEELTNIPHVQYMAVEWDNGANTLATRKAIAFQKKRFGLNKVGACFYPNNIPHSFFSRKDIAKYDETPWVNSFLYEATAFLAFGRPVIESEEISEETIYDAYDDRDTKDRQKRCSIYPVDYSELLQNQE